jgi:glycine betaine/choline ABC-type transport system substrate-binding protein
VDLADTERPPVLHRLRALAVLLGIVLAGTLLIAGVLAAFSRPRGDVVVVGSKAFTESVILSEIVSQWLERSGTRVERRFYLGGTHICFEAVRAGAVDLYPEYTGTGLVAILKEMAGSSSPVSVLERLRREFLSRFGLRWLDPLGFNNTYALAMPRALASRLGVRRISDLLAHPELRAGFASEFLARPDGWPGLRDTYHLTFDPLAMKAGLMYQAAASGQVDVISAYSTDGRVKALDLVVLEDDRHFFPPYQAALVVREAALVHRPGLAAQLGALAGLIGDEEMRQMNAAVDFGGRSPEAVASAFLAQHLSSKRP